MDNASKQWKKCRSKWSMHVWERININYRYYKVYIFFAMVKVFCINKEQVWVYYKYDKRLELPGKKLMGSACNISFKHEDNNKKIVDLKCCLSYSEIFIQKKYFITKRSQGNDMRSLINLLTLLFKISVLIIIHAPVLNSMQTQNFLNTELASK